jgi:hypothetical protein
MIRIHCSSHKEADAIWRAWQQLDPMPPTDLHVDGRGLVATLRFYDDELSAPRAAHQAENLPHPAREAWTQ